MDRVDLTRRDFLKKTGQTALAVGGGLTSGGLLNSCAAIPMKEEGPVQYPRLPGQKIQSPEHYGRNGCYVGAYGVSLEYYLYLTKRPLSIIFMPSIHTMIHFHSFYRAVMGLEENKKLEEASVPLVTYDVGGYVRQGGLESIAKGEWDYNLKIDAQKAKELGEKQGGFFIRTFREMNILDMWPPWRGQPKEFKKAWRYMWNIFDGEGGNEYATWVLSPYSSSVHFAGSWERYYPGDKYVDWVGFNGYNFGGQVNHPFKSFASLFRWDYNRMKKNHPDKPIMIAATGTDEGRSKPKWVTNAFNDVKYKFPGIKAICWWSDCWSHNDISNFNSSIDSSAASLKAFLNGISDPYFISAIPHLKK